MGQSFGKRHYYFYINSAKLGSEAWWNTTRWMDWHYKLMGTKSVYQLANHLHKPWRMLINLLWTLLRSKHLSLPGFKRLDLKLLPSFFFFFFNKTQQVEKMYEEICVSQGHASVCGINFAHFVLILSPARDLCWTSLKILFTCKWCFCCYNLSTSKRCQGIISEVPLRSCESSHAMSGKINSLTKILLWLQRRLDHLQHIVERTKKNAFYSLAVVTHASQTPIFKICILSNLLS